MKCLHWRWPTADREKADDDDGPKEMSGSFWRNWSVASVLAVADVNSSSQSGRPSITSAAIPMDTEKAGLFGVDELPLCICELKIEKKTLWVSEWIITIISIELGYRGGGKCAKLEQQETNVRRMPRKCKSMPRFMFTILSPKQVTADENYIECILIWRIWNSVANQNVHPENHIRITGTPLIADHSKPAMCAQVIINNNE